MFYSNIHLQELILTETLSRLVASLYEAGSIDSEDLDGLKAWLDERT